MPTPRPAALPEPAFRERLADLVRRHDAEHDTDAYNDAWDDLLFEASEDQFRRALLALPTKDT